jgi:23S rRNA (uracil1939-C5)-methyltransferase
VNYGAQSAWKEKRVAEVFKRIGKMEFPRVNPIIPSEKVFQYRNKMDFSFSSVRWLTPEEIESDQILNRHNALGFHRPLQFDKVLDIRKCFLQMDPSNDLRNFIRDFFVSKNISFFDIRQKKGGPRSLIIRSNRKGDFHVILSMYEYEEAAVKELYDKLLEKFSCIQSFWVYHNTKGNDTLYDLIPIFHRGSECLEESLCGLTFHYGPMSFFQVNAEVAEKIFSTALEKSEFVNDGVVWDLYCGVGLAGILFSKKARKVIGIEILEEAVRYARLNAELNEVKNIEFHSGDVKKVIQAKNLLISSKPDVIVCDPPRAGMEKKTIDFLLNAEPKEIIYISCNPATQARDLEMLSSKYQPVFIQPYDMFPQTPHIENLCILKRLE